MRAINPIIAALFLIAAAVIVGVAYIGWSQTWFASTSRTVDLQVTGEIVRTSSSAQLNLQIKNVGTVKLNITKIVIEVSDDTASYTAGGSFSSASISASSGTVTLDFSSNPISLDPGSIVSGYVKADSANAWKSGAKYIITIEFKDVDRGTTLTKTVTIQA